MSVTVYLGAHNILQTYELNRQVYKGYNMAIHPSWNANAIAGDIAVINLTTTVTYTRKNKFICL